MKILHVLASNKFSGAENVVCQIINVFNNDKSIEMTYCSPVGPIQNVLIEKSINYFGIESLSIKNLKKVLKDYKPDIIHAHDMKASFICAIVNKKIPVISHIHNNSFDSRRISLKSLAFLLVSSKIKHFFWVSDSALNDYKFKKNVINKSTVLKNVIDVTELYRRLEEDKTNYSYDVVYLGRLAYPKNPQRLIDVLSLVVSKHPNLKVAIVGNGEMSEEISDYVKELRLEKNIFFLGFQDNPLKILYSSKVMIMTSRWEGIPICALEAKALGVKIVSTPTDGLKDIVTNDKIGFLSNDNNQLAKHIIECILNYSVKDYNKIKNEQVSINLKELSLYKYELKKIYREILRNGENV